MDTFKDGVIPQDAVTPKERLQGLDAPKSRWKRLEAVIDTATLLALLAVALYMVTTFL